MRSLRLGVLIGLFPAVLFTCAFLGDAPGQAPAVVPTPAVVTPPAPAPTPQPAVIPPPAPIVPVVKLNGPTGRITTGGFAVSVKIPEGAEPRWRNNLPLNAIPLEIIDRTGTLQLIYLQPPVGTYLFRLEAQIPAPGLDPWAVDEITVYVDGPVPVTPPVVVPPIVPPVVVPPGPAPIAGQRQLLLIYESGNRSGAQARLHTDLRDGVAFKYIAEKKHNLLILDTDTPDQTGQKAAILTKWGADITTMPILLALDSTGTTLIDKLPLTTAADPVNGSVTPQDVITFIQKTGG